MTGPRARPRPTHQNHGIGVTASTPMSTAPRSATGGPASPPMTTHEAATVDFAIVKTSRNVISADHSVAAGTPVRIRLQTSPGRLSDSDCISRPHQAREVVTAAHDVEVD